MADVEFARQANEDLTRLQTYLADCYVGFGDTLGDALAMARARVVAVRDDIHRALSLQPMRGTLREEIVPGLRHVTIGRTVPYFLYNEEADQVAVLAIFYGGHGHRNRIRPRLLG